MVTANLYTIDVATSQRFFKFIITISVEEGPKGRKKKASKCVIQIPLFYFSIDFFFSFFFFLLHTFFKVSTHILYIY
jgi:hypothetical protein